MEITSPQKKAFSLYILVQVFDLVVPHPLN